MRADDLRAGVLPPHPGVHQRADLRDEHRQLSAWFAAGQHHRDFTEHAAGGPVRELGQRAAHHFLVDLRKLAAHDGAPRRARLGDSVGQAPRQPARRFEEHTRPLLGGQCGQPGPPRGLFARREPLEAELLRRQRRHRQSRGHRRRTRHARHRHPLGDAGRHQAKTGITDHRHACIGDRKDGRAGFHLGDQRRHPCRLVLIKKADDLATDPNTQRIRQGADAAGVLSGDDVGRSERGHQPCGRIRRPAKRGRAEQQSSTGHAAQPTIARVTVAEPETRVAQRDVPVISPGPLAPAADFGPVDRAQGWAMTSVITALAAITRFLNLGQPTDAGTPIFDEKHYDPQAWQLMQNSGVEDNPGYGLVVHPPVGKQLIAIGEAIFGYNGVGWRFSGSVAGVVVVVLVARIARRLSRSTLVGGIAGLLIVADGVSLVTARTALLDGFLTVFVVGAFGALIVDRDQVRARMHVAWEEGRINETPWGPRLGVRWWRFLAGVLLGLGFATKWSGLYFIVFFAAMSLAFDVAARRQYQVPRPWLGVLRRDLGPTAYVMALIPFGVYMASYAPWFASETAIDRYEVGHSIGPGGAMPDAVRSLWHYTYGVYKFHAGLTNSAGNYHPWESKPWAWPMSLRPVLYAIVQNDVPGCGAQSCVKAVLLVGTPAMWWVAVPVLLYATWRTLVRRDWRYAAVLAGYCAGWLPWFADIDRQMYFFYAATMAPFLVMAIALICGDILYARNQSPERRTLGLIAVSCYVALVVTNFAWLFLVLTGLPISQQTWNMEIWLPSWR